MLLHTAIPNRVGRRVPCDVTSGNDSGEALFGSKELYPMATTVKRCSDRRNHQRSAVSEFENEYSLRCAVYEFQKKKVLTVVVEIDKPCDDS